VCSHWATSVVRTRVVGVANVGDSLRRLYCLQHRIYNLLGPTAAAVVLAAMCDGPGSYKSIESQIVFLDVNYLLFDITSLTRLTLHTVFITGSELRQCTVVPQKSIYKVSYCCIICEDLSLHVIYFSYLAMKYLP